MRAYLAGSIFYYGDVLRNTEWAAKIRAAFPDIDLYSPIENTEINGAEGKKKFASSEMIAKADNERLDRTDVLIACIDGDIIPSGTASEIGRFSALPGRRLIVGISTDNRDAYMTHSEEKDIGAHSGLCENQYCYHNLYTVGLIKERGVLVNNIEDAIEAMKIYAKEEEEFDDYSDFR